uniref:Transmembrane protein 26 n=2 Tax=Macrostomum lignano TaxID=282301 RepID=A0A1I8IPQ8_9PLAT
FCPSAFFYLLVTVPSTWFLELELVDWRIECNRTYRTTDDILCKHRRTANASAVHTKGDEDFLGAQDFEQTIRTLEQLLLLLLILGRWMLPKGKLTHDQLSQLLLVYIGTAADIVEFFEAFKEEVVKRDRNLIMLILTIWTWSLLQFVLVITAQRARKDHSGLVASRRRTVKESPATPEEEENYCYCSPEVFGIVISMLLQDLPYLVTRLYMMFNYNTTSYTNVFFTLKNSLVCSLLTYRLVVIYSERFRRIRKARRAKLAGAPRVVLLDDGSEAGGDVPESMLTSAGGDARGSLLANGGGASSSTSLVKLCLREKYQQPGPPEPEQMPRSVSLRLVRYSSSDRNPPTAMSHSATTAGLSPTPPRLTLRPHRPASLAGDESVPVDSGKLAGGGGRPAIAAAHLADKSDFQIRTNFIQSGFSNSSSVSESLNSVTRHRMSPPWYRRLRLNGLRAASRRSGLLKPVVGTSRRAAHRQRDFVGQPPSSAAGGCSSQTNPLSSSHCLSISPTPRVPFESIKQSCWPLKLFGSKEYQIESLLGIWPRPLTSCQPSFELTLSSARSLTPIQNWAPGSATRELRLPTSDQLVTSSAPRAAHRWLASHQLTLAVRLISTQWLRILEKPGAVLFVLEQLGRSISVRCSMKEVFRTKIRRLRDAPWLAILFGLGLEAGPVNTAAAVVAQVALQYGAVHDTAAALAFRARRECSPVANTKRRVRLQQPDLGRLPELRLQTSNLGQHHDGVVSLLSLALVDVGPYLLHNIGQDPAVSRLSSFRSPLEQAVQNPHDAIGVVHLYEVVHFEQLLLAGAECGPALTQEVANIAPGQQLRVAHVVGRVGHLSQVLSLAQLCQHAAKNLAIA